MGRKKWGANKYILAGIVSILFIIIILLSVFSIFNLRDSFPDYLGSYSFSEGKKAAHPRNINGYTVGFEENGYFSAVDESVWLLPDPAVSKLGLDLDILLGSRNWSGHELIDLPVANRGFESHSGDFPVDWSAVGNVEYADKNCFEGERCLYLEADNSSTGYIMLNSRPADVKQFYNYTISFHINCIECDNESAYMSIIWLRNKSREGNPELIVERTRHVLPLHNTDGYEIFTINVQALSRFATKALVQFGVHISGTSIQPRTRLYIDS